MYVLYVNSAEFELQINNNYTETEYDYINESSTKHYWIMLKNTSEINKNQNNQTQLNVDIILKS